MIKFNEWLRLKESWSYSAGDKLQQLLQIVSSPAFEDSDGSDFTDLLNSLEGEMPPELHTNIMRIFNNLNTPVGGIPRLQRVIQIAIAAAEQAEGMRTPIGKNSPFSDD